MSEFNFHITESAAAQIKTIGSSCLRINITGGGCSGFQYELDLADTKSPDDIVVSKNEIEVLIDSEFQDMLNGCTLNFESNLTGSRFKIINPNASKSCGCGNSFAIS